MLFWPEEEEEEEDGVGEWEWETEIAPILHVIPVPRLSRVGRRHYAGSSYNRFEALQKRGPWGSLYDWRWIELIIRHLDYSQEMHKLRWLR